MADGTPTKFWELSQLFLSTLQMIFYLINVIKYMEKLDEMGDTLEDLAKKHRWRYEQFRDMDPAFYNWYDSVPKYEICDSGIRRGKGRSFYELGSSVRKLSRANEGYLPLAMVGKVASVSMNLLKATGSVRAQNHVAEKRRDATDKLAHWKKIVTIPIEREGEYGFFKTPIDSMKQSLLNSADGFNSGGAAFGRALYGFLHSTNRNQENYTSVSSTNSSGNLSTRAITIGWGL